jgi:uncharacterized protein (DUF2267 family)
MLDPQTNGEVMDMRTTVSQRLQRGVRGALERADDVTSSSVWQRRRRRVAARVEDTANRLHGLAYHLRGQHPADDVGDDVLAARVASSLGVVTRRLDAPRLEVDVAEGVVTLRGVVATARERREVLDAARRVHGADDIRPQVRVGYGSGDVRPSEGRATTARSATWHALVGGADAVLVTGDLDEDDGHVVAERAVGAVVGVLLDLLPSGERAHVAAHLPADVRARVDRAGVAGRAPLPATPGAFRAVVAELAGLRLEESAAVTDAVLGVLRERVPEEVEDVVAVLPAALVPLWQGTVRQDA